MKWILIIVLIVNVAILGCTPNDKSKSENDAETTPAIGFDEAMGDMTTGEWLTDYDAALTAAKQLNRPVLVNFTGSDWCSWCIKLANEVFDKEAFKNYAESDLVLLKLDFPRKIKLSPETKASNEKLMKQFAVTGFPTIVLLSPEGEELNRTGYQPGGADKYVQHLKMLLTSSE